MERNARFILVSTFIIITLLALLLFYRWIQGPDPEDMGADTAILFDGSVSGLSIGSDVRYLGVPIGRVSGISLSREFPGRVDVKFATREVLPPASDMVALLEAQGITGLSIIELRTRSADTPGFDVPAGVIPGYPSVLSQLAGSAGRITDAIESTLNRVNTVLDEDTVANLSATIGDLRVLSANLAGASTDFDQLMASAMRISAELERTLPEFRNVAQRLDRELLPTVNAAGLAVQGATATLASAIEDNRDDVRQLLAKDVPTLVGITNELAVALQELNSLLGNINDQPGALLYGEQVREVEISRD
jgi:phospholipid/cholesterol/gamma-HCH transport system substrate-binding protein